MNKFFNGRKYYLEPKSNRWLRTTGNCELLSRDVWNYYHSNDPILKGEVIHHKNGDSSDNRIENLQKMTRGKHTNLHKIGNQYFLGKHHTDETKQKMSDAKLGKPNNIKGKHWVLSGETKQKMSDAKIGKFLGDKNPNWRGGKKK